MTFLRGVVLISLAALVVAQPPSKIYPGAKLDTAATEEARLATATQPEVEVLVFTSADPFEKVVAHFQKTAREFKPIGSRVRKLPTGQELHDAFFILDEGENLVTSKRWVKLQRPYIGQFGLARKSTANDIRDVTAIIVTTKR